MVYGTLCFFCHLLIKGHCQASYDLAFFPKLSDVLAEGEGHLLGLSMVLFPDRRMVLIPLEP